MLESIFFTLFTAWHTIKYMNVGENFLEKNPIFVLFFGGKSYFCPIFWGCSVLFSYFFLPVLLLDTLPLPKCQNTIVRAIAKLIW